VQIAVLGPLEVRDDAGAPVDVAGARLHALLTRLALDAGRPVSVATLVDAVWGDAPPAEETNALQTLVSRLRRVLGAAAVQATPGGYRLAAAPGDVDAHRFEQLAAEGARSLRAGDHRGAAELLSSALALWRGPAMSGALGASDALATPAARLADLHLAARIDHLETRLALDDAAGLVAELEALCGEYPLNERLVGQLIRALVASGRPADALGVYERLRGRLADELGVDPSAELQDLQLRLLRGEAQPERPTSVRRTNLKAQLTSFVGREQEVASIGKSLERNRLVTLVGPGGAGKTRLASEAASCLVDTARDGVWLVELAPVTAGADVPQAVLDVVGLREGRVLDRRKTTTRDALTRLVDGLGDKSVVLVLDNCEHLLDASASLADHLLAQCPDLHVLATSREPLGIVGEVLLAVPPLGQPSPTATAAEALEYPAVRLFADRAAAASPGFAVDANSVATVIDIVRRLDGLPLAIELAAARLRSLALADIAARLSDRFRLLTGGSRTALPRHRTLRAVVEWSWELLGDDERLLVEQLAVFPSGVTVDSATAISDAPPEDVADLLASLVDKSLLQPVGDGRRTRMLETIREYGTEQLATRGELAAVRARHADHFFALMFDAEAHLLTADQLPWFELLRAERENIVAALRYLCDVGDADRALQLAVSLSGYGMMTGLNDEMHVWLREALDVPGGTDDDLRVIGQALRLMAFSATAQSAEGVAEGMQELGRLAARLGAVDKPAIPWLHLVRIAAAFFGDDDKLVREYADAALAHDDVWVRASGHMFHSAYAENNGDVEQMRVHTEAARLLYEQVGERWGLAATTRGLAQLATLDGDLDAAVAAYERAMQLTTELHSRDDEGFLLGRLADLELRRGNIERARAHVERARASAEQTGSAMESAFSLAMLGAVEFTAGDTARARAYHEEAVRRLDGLPREHPVQGHVRAVMLSVAVRMAAGDGDLETARALAREALEVGLGTRDMPVVASVGVGLADLAWAAGDSAAGATILGASAAVRGADDATALDVVRARAHLTDVLGAEGFAACYAAGAALDHDAALAALRVL